MTSPGRRQDLAAAKERKASGGRGDGIRMNSNQKQQQSSNQQQQQIEDEEEDRIGPYLIGEEIGRGSFATVFKGRKIDTQDAVAIKSVIRSKLTAKLLENLESEISILKRITHRNIVELKDCLQTDSHIYLIMPFCSAGDLSQYIRKRGTVPALTASNQGLLPAATPEEIGGESLRRVLYPHPEEGGLNETVVRCFLGQLLDAIRFLRSQNVIHRDIKPQNLLLQPAEASDLANGHPPGIPVLKVADFGFARWLSSADLAETLCGSPLYMAPEILRYEKYDAKADLWSLGAVLYEMSVGKPPFRAQNHVDLLRKINEGEDQINFRDSRSTVKVAQNLKTLIRALLKRNPRERMGFEDFFESAEIVSNLYLSTLPGNNPSVQQQSSSTGGLRSRVPSTAPRSRSAVPPPLAPRPAGPPLAPTTTPATTTTTTTTLPQSHDKNEAAFAVSAGISAYANPVVVPLPPSRTTSQTTTPTPTIPLPPSSTTITTSTPVKSSTVPSSTPSYIDHEPPPFARRPSNATPSGITVGAGAITGLRRSNSAVLRYGSPQYSSSTSPQEIPSSSSSSSKPLAIPGAGRRSSVEHLSRSGTPSSAIERFSARTNESMIESNDSILGRDYVVVEKRTVEINALADELASMPVRDNIITKRPSRGFLSRGPSSLGPSSSSPSSGSAAFPAVLPPDTSSTPFAISNPRQISNSPHPYSLSSSPRPLSFLSSSPRSLPIDRFPGSPLALVGSPTAAIAKALNMASHKIFGSPSDGILLRRSSARKPITRSAHVVDPEEDKVLAELEDIAQKALVIFDFADSKIMQILPPTPQTSSSTSLGTPSYFSHVAAREQASASNPFSAVPTPSSPIMRRTSSSSSSSDRPVLPFVMASSVKAELLAAEAMVLYLKSLAFLGKGIEKARKFWSARGMEQAAGIDFNEAVQWFRQRFNECFDKADFAKSRCQDDIPESATFAERLIYDRALEISRAAAVNELRGENPADIETAYETALWMLHAILDETMTEHSGDLVEEEDRATVKKFVVSITDRLKALRRKVAPVV